MPARVRKVTAAAAARGARGGFAGIGSVLPGKGWVSSVDLASLLGSGERRTTNRGTGDGVRLRWIAILVAAVAVAGCSAPPDTLASGQAGASGTTTVDPGTAPAAGTSGLALSPSGSTPASTPTSTEAEVSLGTFRKSPIAKAFGRYVTARHQAALAYDATLPALAATTTPRWLKYQTTIFDDTKAKGWTWPPVPRYSVVGLVRTGPTTAKVRDCIWGPSGAFINQATGAQEEAVQAKWYQEDTRMVLSKGVWRVDWVYDATVTGRPVPDVVTFSCKGAS